VELLKVEWLDAVTLETKQDLSPELVDEGSNVVTVENGAEGRRGVQMTLKNPAGVWTPTTSPTTEPFFMNNVIRISIGLSLSGVAEYCPLGTFRVNRPFADTQNRTIQIDGQDFWKDFSWGLKQSVRFAPSSTLNSMISTLAVVAGIANVTLDPAGDGVRLQAAPAPSLKFRRGMRLADCFTVLANDFGWEFFFDVLGTLVTRPSLAIDQQVSVFALLDTHKCFKRGRGGQEDSPDIYNHVGVSSTDPAFTSAFGEARDDDPTSPTYVAGAFGERYHEEELDWIQNDGQAATAARNLLRRNLYLSRPAEIDTNPLPFLDVQDVVDLTVADLKVAGAKYFVDSITIPLDRGEQTMRLLEARSIGL
jgi:hypothetical protein